MNQLNSIIFFNIFSRFKQICLDLLQANVKFQYFSVMCQRWVSLRSEFFGNIVVLMTAIIAVARQDHLTAGKLTFHPQIGPREEGPLDTYI